MGPAQDSIMMGIVLTVVMLVLAFLIIVGFSSKIRKSLKIVTNRIELLEKGDLIVLAGGSKLLNDGKEIKIVSGVARI